MVNEHHVRQKTNKQTNETQQQRKIRKAALVDRILKWPPDSPPPGVHALHNPQVCLPDGFTTVLRLPCMAELIEDREIIWMGLM